MHVSCILYHTYRSKTEGHYPELITHTEAKLRELNPNRCVSAWQAHTLSSFLVPSIFLSPYSKLLITSQKAKRVADLPNKEWREVTSDIEVH